MVPTSPCLQTSHWTSVSITPHLSSFPPQRNRTRTTTTHHQPKQTRFLQYHRALRSSCLGHMSPGTHPGGAGTWGCSNQAPSHPSVRLMKLQDPKSFCSFNQRRECQEKGYFTPHLCCWGTRLGLGLPRELHPQTQQLEPCRTTSLRRQGCLSRDASVPSNILNTCILGTTAALVPQTLLGHP